MSPIGAGGNSFDLSATQCVRITGWDFHIDRSDTTVVASLYWRQGTANGFEKNPDGWTQLGSSSTVTAQGIGNPTPFDFGASLEIPAGQTIGIFFITDGVRVDYTNGDTAVTTYTDGPLTLATHSGVSCSQAFQNCAIFNPRIVNTNIYWEPCDSGAGGDPHFKTWFGHWFDFHGQCDLVLLENVHFAAGTGMTIYVRTTARYEYSYIESAVLKIGDDILEVSGWGQYYLNGIANAFPIKLDQYNVTHSVDESNTRHSFEVSLGGDKAIIISTFKDWINIKPVNAVEEDFGTAVGMMGSYESGDLLARNGTVLTDANAFGFEWQVRDTEPQLFMDKDRQPQYPNKCIMPDAKKTDRRLRRRLGEKEITKEEAEQACAHWRDDEKEFCVFDGKFGVSCFCCRPCGVILLYSS